MGLKRGKTLSPQTTGRRTKNQTTLAGGSGQVFLHSPSSLTQDVITFEQAPTTEASPVQQTTVMGTAFRSETQPRSIEVVDIVETMNDAQNYLWIDFSNYVPGDLQTLSQALQISS